MDAKNFGKMIVTAVVLVGILAGFVRADKLALQTKLSKDVKIQLKNVTIAEALEKIGQKAAVKFVLSDEAVWKLPQGEATRLSVALDGPLAESMAEMLNAFFMRYAVGDEEMTIYPRPELEHILGRPTAKQLELLKAVYTNPVHMYYIDEVQKTINKAIGRTVLISPMLVQMRLNDLLRQLVGELPHYIWEHGRFKRGNYKVKSVKEREAEGETTTFELATPVTLVQLLSQVSVGNRKQPYETRWYISGMDFGQRPEIRVVELGAFRDLRLNQKVDISYKDESLDKIFQDLADRAGVSMVAQPGSYLNEHKLSVDMQNITIAQAVGRIADIIGATYEIHGGRIEISSWQAQQKVISPPTKPRATPRATRSRSGSGAGGGDYVGKISIPMDGGKYYIEFMLREKDLTEQLIKLRDEKMKEVLGERAKPKPKPAAAPKK